jgi:uncharacterized protein (TIGR03437 family)
VGQALSPANRAKLGRRPSLTVSGIVVAPTFLPLPQQLSGVSILINDSSVAPILAVADLGDRQQINFQVPHERLLAQKSRLQVMTRDSSGSAQNSAPIDNLDYPKTGTSLPARAASPLPGMRRTVPG